MHVYLILQYLNCNFFAKAENELLTRKNRKLKITVDDLNKDFNQAVEDRCNELLKKERAEKIALKKEV